MNYVIYDGMSISPILEHGLIEFSNVLGFKRGNTNGDNNVDLADALFIVNYLFSGGGSSTVSTEAVSGAASIGATTATDVAATGVTEAGVMLETGELGLEKFTGT